MKASQDNFFLSFKLVNEMQNSVIQWMATKAKLDLVMSIVENKILFVSGTELWTDGQTNRQRRTEAPITR